jgi:sulfate transporter 4
LLYAFLGSSRQLVVGPVAVTSLLLGSGLSNIFGNFQINPSDPGDALQQALQTEYNHAAIQVAFLAGLGYTLIGFLRMGWLINFLAVPVVSGFMTGAASVILTGQIKYITGQKLPRSDTAYENLK